MKRIFFIVTILFFSAFFRMPETAAQRAPKIAYLYPAGGERGTSFLVLAGGRQIVRCTEVVVSGSGVKGRVLQGFPRLNPNSSEENFVMRQFYEEAKQRLEDMKTAEIADKNEKNETNEKREDGKQNAEGTENNIPLLDAVRRRLTAERLEKQGLLQTVSPETLPSPEEIIRRFPYWDALAAPTDAALQKVFYEYFAPRTDKQPKETMGQAVLMEITIDADAEPGDRDLRLAGTAGMTFPVRLIVGTLPEVTEIEPNDMEPKLIDTKMKTANEFWGRQVSGAPKRLCCLPVLELPAVINGQIRAGDRDYFTFHARRGQKLVINVQARHLIPYLADGVPGWFQAAVSLFDGSGKKIGEALSYRHDPDPVLRIDVPKEDQYVLKIHDAVFRGRDDFVYRITIGEQPLVTSVFPAGWRQGTSKQAALDGWNLPEKTITLNEETAETSAPCVVELAAVKGMPLCRPVHFAKDDLPEITENEPNNTGQQAETVTMPVIVNGIISDENDVDYFAFAGRKGERAVIDLASRSLDLPLDSVAELIDPQGKVIAANDDRAGAAGPNIGKETHHADSYLNVEIPADGVYRIRLYDAARRGGKEYAYRLRISAPRPDFAVFCEPPSVTFRNKNEPVRLHLVRKDGFSGEVHVRTMPGAALTLTNGTIAANTQEHTMLLSPSHDFKEGTIVEIPLEAWAMIDGREVVRKVVAVEDQEQAFIYHHWVPAKALTGYKPVREQRKLEAGRKQKEAVKKVSEPSAIPPETK
ncbi:MAG: PPC domain-containing protein [Planctomycetaceae bacterium]|jgi:hypothetical protein|nr:PPC domain-containing protein [Planctomycetaceae bacterium]